MNITIFSNPEYFGGQTRPGFSSMPRFTSLIAEGMIERGHKVEIWAPGSRFFRASSNTKLKKWLGYIDQYVVFPVEVRKKLKACPSDTLFVFVDQAQGPWVPLVSDRPHVIHCHDFLAQLSARGEIEEHSTGWTGKKYQNFILKGLAAGKHFISTSANTRKVLHHLLPVKPESSDVVYNGLNTAFSPFDPEEARALLTNSININLTDGYILHVGNNQWYKNREGAVDIYHAWRSGTSHRLPLLLIGPAPAPSLAQTLKESPYKKDIHIVSHLSDEYLRYAYAGASVFVFPSLAEGFGWPIAEAMACGCPVITTNEAPMTEVAGDAGFLIPRRTMKNGEVWAAQAAEVVGRVVDLPASERSMIEKASVSNSQRFSSRNTLDLIERIYKKVSSGKKDVEAYV